MYDEQFGEHHAEFFRCLAKLKGLRAGGRFEVSVRASTGMLWGGWSAPATFATQLPVTVSIPFVAQEHVAVSWARNHVEQSTPHSATQKKEDFPAASETTTRRAGARRSAECHCRQVGVVIPNGGFYATPCTPSTFRRTRSGTALGGLTSNTPYGVCVRPHYSAEETGPWSPPAYFVTMSPFRVTVGRVGETFVQVAWERDVQQTIGNKMKFKHFDMMKLLDAQLRDLEDRKETVMQQSLTQRSASPVTLQDMAGDPSETAAAASESTANAVAPEAEIAFIEKQIAEMRTKIEQQKQLHTLQAAELERTTTYAKGEDLKYEMVLRGCTEDSQQPQQLILRRKLGKGEVFCRLESLTPRTTYEVVVRSVFAAAQQIGALHMTDISEVDEETQSPWGQWSEAVSFVTLKPITTAAKGIGSECFAVEWDTGLSNDSSSTQTAISRFQIHLVEPKKSSTMQRPDITLEDASLKGHVVGGLVPNTRVLDRRARVLRRGQVGRVVLAHPLHHAAQAAV